MHTYSPDSAPPDWAVGIGSGPGTVCRHKTEAAASTLWPEFAELQRHGWE